MQKITKHKSFPSNFSNYSCNLAIIKKVLSMRQRMDVNKTLVNTALVVDLLQSLLCLQPLKLLYTSCVFLDYWGNSTTIHYAEVLLLTY